jgi:hypothetical protein
MAVQLADGLVNIAAGLAFGAAGRAARPDIHAQVAHNFHQLMRG